MISKYRSSVEEYLTLPKDIGFEYMESLVAEIEEEEKVSWTVAYEMFCKMVDELTLVRY